MTKKVEVLFVTLERARVGNVLAYACEHTVDFESNHSLKRENSNLTQSYRVGLRY